MKEVILSEEEWNRLASITSKEKEKAMNFLARWIHHEIIKRGFNLEVGPFSRAARGGYAVDVICDECEEALLCGEVHWKPDQELKWVLVDIAKSKMGHIIRDYYNRGHEYTLISDQEYREGVEMDIAEQWIFEACRRDWGYEQAREAVKNHPELLAYLDALFKDDNYYGIASLLGIDVKVVMRLETKLLKLLDKK